MDKNAKRLKAIGAAIAAKREREGISQADLARMLGYTNHAHLSRVESGKKAPSLDMLFDIADALDVHVGFFFTEI